MQGAPSPPATTTVPNAGLSPTTATAAAKSAHTAATNITTTRARICRWSGNDLSGLDIYREQGLDFNYEFEYHTDLSNTPALCNLDLNALLFDVCPDIEDTDFSMGAVLSGIGRLGKRSAHLTNSYPDESMFSVEPLPTDQLSVSEP